MGAVSCKAALACIRAYNNIRKELPEIPITDHAKPEIEAGRSVVPWDCVYMAAVPTEVPVGRGVDIDIKISECTCRRRVRQSDRIKEREWVGVRNVERGRRKILGEGSKAEVELNGERTGEISGLDFNFSFSTAAPLDIYD